MSPEEITRLWQLSMDDAEGMRLGFTTQQHYFAALVAAAEREAILPMLKGIDCTETEDPDGWWETSAGAEFGAGILAAIRARGQA